MSLDAMTDSAANVQRYTFEGGYEHDGFTPEWEDDWKEYCQQDFWVKASDYDVLLAQVEALEKYRDSVLNAEHACGDKERVTPPIACRQCWEEKVRQLEQQLAAALARHDP